MWHKIVQTGLLKDVFVLAGAYGVIQGVRVLRRTKALTAFDAYPTVLACGYDRVLTPLFELEQSLRVEEILAVTEHFLCLSKEGNVRRDGFQVNQLGNEVARKTKAVLNAAKRGASKDAALAAVHYERDSLPSLESMLDDTLRNMLMDHVA